MSAAQRPGVATHYLRYVTANVLVLVAGFVSFPIMTRLLDNREYGILGYFDTWLLVLTGAFKLGGQHTILRFYPHNGDAAAIERFGANFLLVPMLASLGLWLLALLAFGGYSALWPDESLWVGLCMLLLVPPTVWTSFVASLVMALDRSDFSARLQVAMRWLQLVAMLGVVYFIERSALGAFAGRLIVGLICAAYLTWWVARQLPMKRKAISRVATLEGFRFGLPMVLNEIASVLLAFVDRLMLKAMLGDFAFVGVYTIGYALAMNINSLVRSTLTLALTQVSTRLYEIEGAAAVVAMKVSVMRTLVYACAALTAGLACVGGDMLLFMAGADKAASAPVFVWVSINYVLYTLIEVSGYGLLLVKRSGAVLMLTVFSAVLNVVLNLFWIPAYGVMGAVYATFVSYLALGVVQYLMCPRELRKLPDARATAIATLLGLLVYTVAERTQLFGVVSHLGRLFAMAALELVLFIGPMLLFDRTLREWLFKRLRGTAT